MKNDKIYYNSCKQNKEKIDHNLLNYEFFLQLVKAHNILYTNMFNAIRFIVISKYRAAAK